MSKSKTPLMCLRVGGAYVLMPNDVWYPTEEEIKLGEVRGEIATQGPWGGVKSYKALATSGRTWEGMPLIVYGLYTLTNCQEAGHSLEGTICIHGEAFTGFTSSVLFELPEGKLISVATIHVRRKE